MRPALSQRRNVSRLISLDLHLFLRDWLIVLWLGCLVGAAVCYMLFLRRTAYRLGNTGLARRFSVIGSAWDFAVIVNGEPITVEERDLTRLLDEDASGSKYLWEYDEEVEPDTGWRVNGWIGALKRTDPLQDGIQRGIAILARGKLVQEPSPPNVLPPADHEATSTLPAGRTMTVSDYRDGARLIVRRVRVTGLAHAWSGGDDAFPYNDPHPPDATALLAEFVAGQV